MKTVICFIALTFVIAEVIAQNNAETVPSETEMQLETATGTLYGTLTLGNQPQPSPLVLIIAGSGPTDRDGNSPPVISVNSYKMLAEGFAQNGVATLRYDKRGIGESKAAMIAESDLRFETYVNDAIDWITLLKADKRFSAVYVLGHSEGALIGTLVAEKTPVNGFLSVAGTARPIDVVLKEQLRAAQFAPQLIEESDKILDSLKAGKTVSNVSLFLASIYRPSVQPYLISWLKYDPAQEIQKLSIPVLIIQGTTDLQVPVADAELLAAANPAATLRIFENMNHVLKEADLDRKSNLATYQEPDLPLKAGLTDAIVEFIRQTAH